MLTLTDHENNEYQLNRRRELWLELRGKQVFGSRSRLIGWIRDRVLFIERLNKAGHWHTKSQCWYANFFVVKNNARFDYDVIHFKGYRREGMRTEWIPVEGWIAPQVILWRFEIVHYKGWERQLAFRPEDVYATRQQAIDSAWDCANKPRPERPVPPSTKKRAKVEPPPAQGVLFG